VDAFMAGDVAGPIVGMRDEVAGHKELGRGAHNGGLVL
jgi:hypothetical protein